MPTRAADFTPHHGIHPAPRQSPCHPVDWRPSLPRADRVQVRKHTCACRKVVYELCTTAGLIFIRRQRRENGVINVHESTWLRTPEGERLWAAILAGHAR